jgi:hypothetical protein
MVIGIIQRGKDNCDASPGQILDILISGNVYLFIPISKIVVQGGRKNK